MEAEGALLTIAEISVALAGFASIVVAIRGANPSAWSSQDRFGLGNVFAASVAALLGSLLPFPLHYLTQSADTLWLLSNAAFGAMVLAYLTFLMIRQWGAPPRVPSLFWSFVGFGYLLGIALMLAGFGILLPSGPAVLLVGLIWALMAAFAQLATFLLLSTSGR